MRCRPGALRFYFDSKVNYGARPPPPVSVMDGAYSPFTKLGKAVTLAPVVANGVLYVLDDGGRITAFR